jgi:tetratricopeptide (TPR) repeat protein
MKVKPIIILIITVSLAASLYSVVLGKLRMKVVDSKGNPIAGVKITLLSTRVSTMEFKITTDKKGIALQNGLLNHVFTVTLEKDGYQTVKKNVKIPAGLLQREYITMHSAVEVRKEYLDNDPHSQAINSFNKAASLINEKKYQEALEPLNHSVSLDDTLFQAHYYLGYVYFELGEYQEALQSLSKVLEIKENYVQAYRLLAAVHERMGNTQESERYTRLAREKGGKTPFDIYREGIYAFNTGSTNKAIAAFEKVIQMDEKYADAYYRLGLCYMNKNENDKAIAALKKYIQLKPDGENVDTAKSIIDSLK